MKTIYPKTLFVSFVTILLCCSSSCKKSATTAASTTPPPDPPGTNVVNLLTGTGIVLDDTVNAFATYGTAGLGYYFYTNSLLLDLDANLNLNFSYAAGVNAGLSWIVGCSNGIINLGPVNGLASITTHPTSGFSSTSLAQVGTGYVVESVDNNPVGSKLVGTTYTSVPRTLYYRIYVTTTVLNTSNAVAGYTIKYQGPF